MRFIEEHRNLFEVDSKYCKAQCISSDIEMGAGIAVDFQKHYGLRGVLREYHPEWRKHPTCILEKGVFNLITKERYWHKPTYGDFTESVMKMRNIAVEQGIKHIATYRLGCTRDKLSWPIVRKILEEVFKDTDIEILVCIQ